MAKYKTSGLITEIRGSMGDKTFYYWKGIPVIRKKKVKHKQGNSLAQTKGREIFSFLSRTWKSMGFEEWAVWEMYAKGNRRKKSKQRSGLMCAIGNWFYGRVAFMSTNQLLMICGFSFIQKPLFGKPQPPLPQTDLPPLSKWSKNIKFNIWLPEDYPDRCVVQIWIRKLSWPDGRPYIMAIVPISSSPIEIKVEKIRFYEKGRGMGGILEKSLNEIGDCKLLLQMRTVAENGKFSMPSAIYKIELRNYSSNLTNSTTFHPIAKNRIRFPTNK